MYKSYGISLSIKSIYSLSAPFVEGTECLETIFDLKPSYIRFLQSIHPQFPIRTDRLFVRDGFEVAAFSASSIDDLQQEQMVSAEVDEKLYHIFIDELTTAHFNYGNLTKKPYWALSSILKRQRPMDKVVHSIIVSMKILHARKTYLPQTNDPVVIQPKWISLAANVRNSIESVLSHPLLDDVCKPRSISFMKTALDQLGAL